MKTTSTWSSKFAVVLFIGISAFASAYGANQETFYENASGSPLVAMLKAAKASIDIEIYEMDDPLVQAALQAAIGRGVRVRIIQQEVPVGAACRVFNPANNSDSSSCAAQKSLVTYVRAHGGTYVPFQNVLCGTPGSHCYEHGKMVITDSSAALLSTGNFNTTNLCTLKEHPNNCNRDYSVVTTDQTAVNTLSQVFTRDLAAAPYDVGSILKETHNQKLTVSPLSLNPLVSYIDSAKVSLLIQNQYLKDVNLNAAILRAAKRGVKVFVMVASACSFGKPKTSDAQKWTAIYSAFDKAGVHTRIFTRKILVKGVSGYLHAKAMLVDGLSAWVGSVNGSTMSLANNREYGIFLQDQTQVAKLNAFMVNDFNNPDGETWKDSLTCKNDPAPTPQNGDDPNGDASVTVR